MLPYVICHVAAVSCAFFIVQGDLKKRKYKIRGIKEKEKKRKGKLFMSKVLHNKWLD